MRGGHAAVARAQHAAGGLTVNCQCCRQLEGTSMPTITPRVRTAFLAALALSFSAPAIAEVSELETGRAQGEMLKRIDEAVSNYVRQIGIDESYVGYCRTKLGLETNKVPVDGSIPFGINYKAISTSEELNTIITARENFERSFIILCLSSAKQTLNQAANLTAAASDTKSEEQSPWLWAASAFLIAGIGFWLGRRTGSLK